jgi:hypothetical protein
MLKKFSEDPANTVIGLVRNVEAAKAKVAAEIDRPNVHIIHADINDYTTLPVCLMTGHQLQGQY